MSTECAFILPNGQKCRCAATRNHRFCRHHGAASAAAGRPVPKHRRYSRIARWTELGRALHVIGMADIPFEAHSIFRSLLEDGPTGISDREAGRLLRGLFRRYGSVPFPLPDEPNEPSPSVAPVPSASPQQQRSAAPDPTGLLALLAKIGPGNDGDISDEDLLKACSEFAPTRPSLISTQPSLISTRPSPHQTRSSLNQTRPSAK